MTAHRALQVSDLSPDQLEVYSAVRTWLQVGSKTKQILTMAGYAGTGKGQPLDALVMTPWGARKMGEIEVGMRVSNPDGGLARVLAVHELGVREIFRVTFADDTSTLVTEDHLWLHRLSSTKTKLRRGLVWDRVGTTAELRDHVSGQRGVRARPLIPLTSPVLTTINDAHRREPIPPYVLGALLGDGGLTGKHGAMFTSADLEVLQRIERLIGARLTHRQRYDYYIAEADNTVPAGLRELGLVGKKAATKFIPDDYKYGPLETRWELARGLMDTDGTVDCWGGAQYTTVSEQLADDFVWVLQSLGFRARKRSKNPTYTHKGVRKVGQKAFTLFIQGPETAKLFHLTRKQRRCGVMTKRETYGRRVVSIEPAGRAAARCITVDHPNGLYLTNDFIVTHNSSIVGVLGRAFPGPTAYCCFTGKAASVLGRKLAAAGIKTTNKPALPGKAGGFSPLPYCGTIHGLIFRPCDSCMKQDEHEHTYGPGCDETPEAPVVMATVSGSMDLEEPGGVHNPGGVEDPFAGWTPAPPVAGPCLACKPPPPVKQEGPCLRCNNARFLRRDKLDRAYRLICVDEASMCSDDMVAALKSYNVPILAVGDHGQLPPVKGTGSLMKAPDLRLEKIHRQAEGNPIIALSKFIRETGDIDDSLEDGNAFTILSRRDLPSWIAKRFTPARLLADPRTPEGILGTVLVSWTNKLRVNLNYDVREALGRADTPPGEGEVMICLKNAAPIYNGMRGVLLADAKQAGSQKAPKWKADIDFVEDGQVDRDVFMSEHQFFAEKTLEYEQVLQMGLTMSQLGRQFDFGFALTCHKMQGSQAPEVGVVVEPGLMRMGREERTKWLYTSCTRSSSKLCVIR